MRSEVEYTEEFMFDNNVVCYQHKSGYRFSVDAVLLAHFLSPPQQGDKVLDLGTGCGIIPLILAYRYPFMTCTGIEIQPSLAELALRNFSLNQFAADRLSVIQGDYCDSSVIMKNSFDRVVGNPPYYKREKGRINPITEKAVARHEIKATLEDVVRASSRACRSGARVALVYPPERQEALLECLNQNNLRPGRIQMVFPYPGGDAVRVLVEAVKNGVEEIHLLPSLFLQVKKNGSLTPHIHSFYKA